MKQEAKSSISQQLEHFVNNQAGSMKRAANMLKGVSIATISNVLNNKWDSISDEMWRSIDAQVNADRHNGWNVVETRSYKLMQNWLKDAQLHSLVMGIVGDAGCGKTQSINDYAATAKNCIVVKCKDYWNRRLFLTELLRAMGKSNNGDSMGEMMEEIVRTIKRMDSPALFLDEADKLNDQILYFFISLYNDLEDNCGMVLIATDHLEKRIKRGVRLNKKGYKEIYSRLGRRFLNIDAASSMEIAAICKLNGIEDKEAIKEVISECDYDLRRVKRMVHARQPLTD